MGLVTVSRDDFGKPEFLVGIGKLVSLIKEATDDMRKLPVGEQRQKIIKGFFGIFAYVETGKGKNDRPIYGLSTRDIADATGYSVAMVGHYKTLYENQDKVLTVGHTKPECHGIDEKTGDLLMQEAEPITAKVGDVMGDLDVAELAGKVRQGNRQENGKGRPKRTPKELGQKAADAWLKLPADQQAPWLDGFVSELVSVARHQIWAEALQEATRRRNRAVGHVETQGQQAIATG